jgi:NSS family neurotransmitter:Na+ symporter
VEYKHETWSSQRVFFLAIIGQAIGLGNIWRFPYITGENGGGAFVIIYCLSMLVIGIPLIMAELAIGRRGGGSAVKTMKVLTKTESCSPAWRSIGILSVLIPFVGLIFYAVVAGWILDYLTQTAAGNLLQLTSESSSSAFKALTDNPYRLAFWHGVFILLTIIIVSRGLRGGLEKAVKMLMPGLALILAILLIYVVLTADFAGGVKFLFNPDFSKVNSSVIMMAIGQAFFSLAIAVGAMITYGAYLPKSVSITRAAFVIGFSDTLCSLLVGLVVFPLVLTYGLEAGEGPGLVFMALPIAFGTMPLGALFGSLFFLLMLMAALTSSMGMLEPVVAWLVETSRHSRRTITIFVGCLAWLCGLSAVLSFNVLSDFTPLDNFALFEGKRIFDLLDFFTANVFIPTGALLIALFAGWAMKRTSIAEELNMRSPLGFRCWYLLIRYVTPVTIVLIFISNLNA